ncbi:phosphatase [Helicobacter turcicus]|uniref:Phosphatase n=1 Tax=Helicobacter turcicus TaxID=2867412 RepID=A0ABS7JMT1_9HELI|nr:phosphatase [Helicobacter turcicus]MBX7490685.1 phosphatase [Helicobacter turcicus]MBX7545407.1 phosphatase [Helicobacter turcicus]
MEIIGIDLGSNSLRGVRMEVRNNGEKKEFVALKEYDSTVRTAEGLEKSGEICKSAVCRIVEHLLEMKRVLGITQGDSVVALTTQAMRKARNSEAVIEEIFHKSGIRFRIIDGLLEAKITALAPKLALERLKIQKKYQKDCFLLVDMGGASSEFIVCGEFGGVEFAKSFEIGIVSAKDRFCSVENLKICKDVFLKPIVEFVESCKIKGAIPKFLLANSGTPTLVCAFKLGLEKYDARLVFGKELVRADFDAMLQEFLALNKESQIACVGEYKADVVPFGIALFTCFMEALGFEECLVMDEGLREGAVIASVLGLLKA